MGTWSSIGRKAPIYDEISHSGAHGIRIYDGQKCMQLLKSFNAVTEVFISYWFKVPEGTNFPYADNPRTFPNASCWKFLWLWDGHNGFGGNDDLCLPTHCDRMRMVIAGNDQNTRVKLMSMNDMPAWWSWTNWMRFSFWLKANESDPTLNGKIYWQAVNEGVIFTENLDTDKAVFDGDDNEVDDATIQWTNMSFPGWIKSNREYPDKENSRPVYDDFYMATGSNAAARVEVGNASTYSNCTNFAIATVTSWSNTEISAVLRQQSFSNFNTTYLYVFDSDNNVNNNGYPLTIKGNSQPASKNLIEKNELQKGKEGELQLIEVPSQNPEVVWLPQGIDLTKHSMGPFTVKVRVEGVNEQRYPSIFSRIKYYMGTGSGLGYFDMIKEGDNVWRFDIPDSRWYRYRAKSLRYQVKVFDEEGNVITESNWQKELIDSFVQQN